MTAVHISVGFKAITPNLTYQFLRVQIFNELVIIKKLYCQILQTFPNGGLLHFRRLFLDDYRQTIC